MEQELLDIPLHRGPQPPPPHLHVLHALPSRDHHLAALEAEQHDRRVVRAVDQAREERLLEGALGALLRVHPLQVERLAPLQVDDGVAHDVLDHDVLHEEVHPADVLPQHPHHPQRGVQALVPALRPRQHQLPRAEEQHGARRAVDADRDRRELVLVVEAVGQHRRHVVQ
eukprot:335694-Hanusia_phi.AAC.1